MTKDSRPLKKLPQRFELTLRDPEALFDPRWLRRRGHRELATVDETGALTLDSVLFVFETAKGSLQHPPGTEVLVSFGRPRIYCELVTEIQAHAEFLKLQHDEAAARVRANLKKMRS